MAQYDEEIGGEGNVRLTSAKAGEDQIHVAVEEESGWLLDRDYDISRINKIFEVESEELKKMEHVVDNLTIFCKEKGGSTNLAQFAASLMVHRSYYLLLKWLSGWDPKPKVKMKLIKFASRAGYEEESTDLGAASKEVSSTLDEGIDGGFVKDRKSALCVEVVLLNSRKQAPHLVCVEVLKSKASNVKRAASNKGGGMIRGTHMHTQHDEVIGGKLGKLSSHESQKIEEMVLFMPLALIDMIDRRAEVVGRLKALEDGAAPLIGLLQNPNAVQELRADKKYNLQMLNDRYQIGPEQIDALYDYAKFQFECGNYSGAADYLYQYRALCTNSDKSLSALWGKLAAEVLMQNWDIALEELNRLKEIIDSKNFSSPLKGNSIPIFEAATHETIAVGKSTGCCGKKRIHQLTNIGWLVSALFPKPRVKMKVWGR